MWILLVLLSVLFSAFSVIITKKILVKISPLLLFWIVPILASPVYILAVFKNGFPEGDNVFWISIIGSVIFYSASYILSCNALKLSQASEVYPLTSFRVLFTILIAMISPLREYPSLIGFTGIILIIFGVYFFKLEKDSKDFFKPFKKLREKPSLMFILSTLLLSITIIFDKIAILHTTPQNSSYVVFMENNFIILIFLIPVLIREKSILKTIKENIFILILLGFLQGLSSIFAFIAIPKSEVGYISALQNFQIVIVVILSFLFLNERKNILYKIGGSIIMSIGVILIGLYG